jgi:hypothetical protein
VKRLAIVLLVLAAGCDEDKPDTAEVAAAKSECKSILEQIVKISPQGTGLDPKAVVAQLPIEDIQDCVATDPLTRRCIAAAKDVAAIKACPGECIGTLGAYRGYKRTKAKLADDKPSTALDAGLFPIADKCLAGDKHAADDYKLNDKGELIKADPLPSL